MFIVFDLDGTLADIEHRRHHIEGKPRKDDANWKQFFEECINDKPIAPIIETFKALHADFHKVEIWSGRSEIVRPQTEAWLLKHTGIKVRLLMRPAGNIMPDTQLKKEWLMKLTGDGPDLVFEDRRRVVEMWRGFGIKCVQVAEGRY